MNNLNNGIEKNTQDVVNDLKSGSKNFGEALDKGKEAVKSAFQETKENVKDSLEDGKETLEDKVIALQKDLKDMKDAGERWINRKKFKNTIHKCGETVTNSCKESKEKVCEHISDKPLQSALIIGGIGLLLGLVASSKRSRFE